VDQLLRQREPLYRQCADLTVDTTTRTTEEVVEMIEAWLRDGTAVQE
jgi:shikimate kinase